VDAPLYHCPTYNVFASGRVCTGSHAFPADPGRVPAEFFRSYFSATGDTGGGRSRRYPDDIGRLWAELRGKATYPLTTSSRSCGSPTRCIWETDRSVSMALVEYLIARDGMPPRRGLAYDYVLAGNGLYLAAANRYLEVRVPVAAVPVRGLPPIYPSITLRTGRLPLSVWDQILVMARTLSRGGLEVMLAVTHDEAAGYRLILPQQAVGPVHVRYRPLDHVVLEIHSHRRYPARFSATDDADEQGLRLYGVLGRLDRMRPEVALRVGAYGHFLPVPWETVFAGDRGAFRDANFEPDTEGATDDDVPG
jgi:PRTRC genetic system protein A